ncbi:hypothetical protein Lser_V15G01260 [Lactuca serriola]
MLGLHWAWTHNNYLVGERPTHHVRVIAISNSLKQVSMSATAISSNGSQLAVYQKLIESIRGNRKEVCESGHYQ